MAGTRIVTGADGIGPKDVALVDQLVPAGISALFTGALLGSAVVPVTSFMSNPGSTLALVNVVAGQSYPTSARVISKLRVTLLANTITVNATVTLFKNGVATAMTITILSTDVAGTKYVDSAHPITFADGDDFDVQLGAAVDAGVGTVKVSATLE